MDFMNLEPGRAATACPRKRGFIHTESAVNRPKVGVGQLVDEHSYMVSHRLHGCACNRAWADWQGRKFVRFFDDNIARRSQSPKATQVPPQRSLVIPSTPTVSVDFVEYVDGAFFFW